jgi:predicted RNA methylase
MRYDTPDQVARLLARYAPRRVRSLLDPAAGSGVLARPFYKRKGCKRIQLLDIDHSTVSRLKIDTASVRSVSLCEEDFLLWSMPGGGGHRKRFDCIIMNPPFAGRLEDLVSIQAPDTGKLKKVPVEAAFVYSATRLLRHRGRLLAILPASVVSGGSTVWLRKFLIQRGNIRLVHELPRGTFSGVEARMYMFVFERGEAQGALVSRNHRLLKPDELRISRTSVTTTSRFDFRFHEAQTWFEKLRSRKRLKWVRLGSVSEVLRGDVDSPIKSNSVLHTTNFSTLKNSSKQRSPTSKLERIARYGDIILKRVGRYAASSPILYKGKGSARCSDCILIIRPHSTTDVNRLLFSLRIMIAWSRGSGLVEHGVGATYIPANHLCSLELPLGLARTYSSRFKLFSERVRKSDWESLPEIESAVRQRILGRASNHG